jgi:hypothetical protein
VTRAGRALAVVPWALGVLVAVVALLHVLDPRDPWHRFVSEYGVAHPLLLGVAFAGWSAAALALVPSLWRLARPAARASAAGFVLFALPILVASVFQIDGPSLEAPKTAEGTLHVASGRAAVAVLGLVLVAGWGRRQAGARRLWCSPPC